MEVLAILENLLTKETLGVDVIAIGVPTVVDAATLANSLRYGNRQFIPSIKKQKVFMKC